MEESKAAAYYDELTRKGEGAAKFKQGLGFTTTVDSAVPIKVGAAATATASSYLNSFVKSSDTNTPSKSSELHSIQNKLKKKSPISNHREQSRVSDRKDNHLKRRSRSRSRDRGSRNGDHNHEHHDQATRVSDRKDRHSRRRSRDRGWRRNGKSRSLSPARRNGRSERSSKVKVDYSRLIDGYDNMSPAERVKAKMKLQLSETVEKDAAKGMGSGWERFEFNKDAPLDDEEIEAAEDDVKLVKHIGQSFRFAAVEARKEEEIKDAHDNAMFGVPAAQISTATDHILEEESNKTESNKSDLTSLVSEKVLAKQQGSWRDRVRKV